MKIPYQYLYLLRVPTSVFYFIFKLLFLILGGSLIKTLAEDILPHVRTDFSKWRIFFCDERMVPFDHPESTYGSYKKLLLGKFPNLTEECFVPVNTSLSGM